MLRQLIKDLRMMFTWSPAQKQIGGETLGEWLGKLKEIEDDCQGEDCEFSSTVKKAPRKAILKCEGCGIPMCEADLKEIDLDNTSDLNCRDNNILAMPRLKLVCYECNVQLWCDSKGTVCGSRNRRYNRLNEEKKEELMTAKTNKEKEYINRYFDHLYADNFADKDIGGCG